MGFCRLKIHVHGYIHITFGGLDLHVGATDVGNMKDVMDRVMRVKVVVYTKEDEMCHDHVTDVRDVRDDEKDQLMKVI